MGIVSYVGFQVADVIFKTYQNMRKCLRLHNAVQGRLLQIPEQVV